MSLDGSSSRKTLRLWPGVAAGVLLVLGSFVVPRLAPDAMLFEMPLGMFGVIGGVFAALAIVFWWLFFSRAPWSERLSALVLMVVAVMLTRLTLHESIAGAGMGFMFFVYAVQGMSLAFVVWAVASRNLAAGRRRASMAATILIACGAWALVRTGGVGGSGGSDLHWRWTPTPEERLLADSTSAPPSAPARAKTAAVPAAQPRPVAPEPSVVPPVTSEPAVARGERSATAEPAVARAEGAVTTEPDVRRVAWPGFRGPARDGVSAGVRISTNWAASPPVELWRRPIGPGWSSFAVDGDVLYTQEQRGNEEIVAAYAMSTGEPIWMHRDAVRFYESNGGAGPRATPTVHNGRVYALGATGILNALDASTGAVVWSRNAATDTGTELPGWGFAGSPLVIDDLVIVAVSGRLAAYHIDNGAPRWTGPSGGAGYSSPHLATIAGVPQVLLLRGSRTTSVAPADGAVLWEHTWQPGASIVQPAFTGDGDVLVAGSDAMGGLGIRCLKVSQASGSWSAEERWTTRGLKPYFNDFVVHKGHAYGFDGSILAAIDLGDGTRKWKGGRYGNGQLILLPEQDLLLVLSEDGELALVSATADRFAELARIPALEGKTWNHPALVGDVLLVRNGEEMAAFRLPLASR